MLTIEDEFNKFKIVSLVLSILFCVLYGIDIIQPLGFESEIAYIGMILTGILFSRGSGFVHDLLDAVYNFKEKE